MKSISFILLAFFAALHVTGQGRLIVQPEKPKAGESIRFEYRPGNAFKEQAVPPEAFVLQFAEAGNKIIDLPLHQEQGAWMGQLVPDSASRLLAFGFAVGDQLDNNQDSGYLVPLYQKDGKLQAGSQADMAAFYHQFGERYFGTRSQAARAVELFNKEFAAHPESKSRHIQDYLRAVMATDKQQGAEAVQLAIENQIKAGLETKQDFTDLINLYNLAGLRQQRMYFTQLREEKFPKDPQAAPDLQELYQRFEGAEDDQARSGVLKQTLAIADTAKEKARYQSYISYFQRALLSSYAEQEAWDLFDQLAATVTDKSQLSQYYNGIAWDLQESGKQLKRAELMAAFAATNSKKQWKQPTGPKPDMMRASTWENSRKRNYAAYADTYAMVLYKNGKFKKALPFAREAALEIGEGKDDGYNNTYALVAEKSLRPAKYLPSLEQFVKNGKSTEKINEIIKTQYLKKHTSAEFDQYIAALEREALLKMKSELKESILNTAAPAFTLWNLEGRQVQLADYKDKVVIVDFWATWCGPCIASFPGMKKMVEKYQSNPQVEFLFVNTWENADDKKKNAGEFISKNDYESFHVLLDNQDKVVKDFGVSGIPTKFVIGRDGKLKFKSVGFGGEAHLVKELPLMIELAAE